MPIMHATSAPTSTAMPATPQRQGMASRSAPASPGVKAAQASLGIGGTRTSARPTSDAIDVLYGTQSQSRAPASNSKGWNWKLIAICAGGTALVAAAVAVGAFALPVLGVIAASAATATVGATAFGIASAATGIALFATYKHFTTKV